MPKVTLDYEVNENGCFIVTSHIPRKNGYCQFQSNNKKVFSHRFVYEECFGPIPSGLLVRHKCDVRNCINPEHLEVGTALENSRDMILRDRSGKGSKNSMAKLNEEQVIKIKQMLSSGRAVKSVAEEFKVNYAMIYKIKTNRRWGHISNG